MRLCRDRLMIVLRPRAIRHKFRLGTGFTAAFLARQVPTSGRRKTAAKTDSRGWTPSRRPLRYRSQAINMNAGRSLQVAGRHGPADHKNTRPTALCVGAVRNGGPLRDSITAHSDIMVGVYEPRTKALSYDGGLLLRNMSHLSGPGYSRNSKAGAPRARPYESDAAVPQQTQIDNDASGSPQRVAGRPPLLSVGGIVLHRMGQKGSGTAPTVSHTGDELIFTANCKRKTRLSWWAASFAVCHLRHWLRGLQNMAKGD